MATRGAGRGKNPKLKLDFFPTPGLPPLGREPQWVVPLDTPTPNLPPYPPPVIPTTPIFIYTFR